MSVEAATVAADPASTFEAAVVVFGRDERGKAHGSRFAAADAELAERAAGLMGMRCLRVSTAEHAAAASGLPAGRIFATGRGFTPFLAKSVYEALCAFPEVYDPPTPEPALAVAADTAPATWPTTGPATDWATLEPGQLVLAPEEPEVGGYYEAVIIEAKLEELFELRWRNWPEIDAFVRHRHDLALLHAQAEV